MAISKNSTIFVQSSWNFGEIIPWYGNYFHHFLTKTIEICLKKLVDIFRFLLWFNIVRGDLWHVPTLCGRLKKFSINKDCEYNTIVDESIYLFFILLEKNVKGILGNFANVTTSQFFSEIEIKRYAWSSATNENCLPKSSPPRSTLDNLPIFSSKLLEILSGWL